MPVDAPCAGETTARRPRGSAAWPPIPAQRRAARSRMNRSQQQQVGAADPVPLGRCIPKPEPPQAVPASGCTCRSGTGSTPTCCCSTCSCANERRGRWPVSAALAALPRGRRAVVLPAHRRPRGSGRVSRGQATASSIWPRTRPRSWPANRSTTRSAGHGRRVQVLPPRWLVAADPGVGTEPLVRVYTEATSGELRDALLVAGEALVRGS